MASRIAFEEPLVVWLVPDRHDLGMRRIWSVEDGLAALHRYGIQQLGGGERPSREWREASAALNLARRYPTPGAVEHARRALGNVAERAGALAVPESLSVLAANGFDFAP
jgi:hypothetical protein